MAPRRRERLGVKIQSGQSGPDQRARQHAVRATYRLLVTLEAPYQINQLDR